MSTNLIDLTRKLIRRKSITPADDGALNIIKNKVNKIGFVNKDLPFGTIKDKDLILNLYSIKKVNVKKYTTSKTLCFAGHTDVVPAKDADKWKFKPFSATVDKNKIYGRGASDMKGAIAAWIIACEETIKEYDLNISLAILITGDEEGLAKNGTKKMVKWLKKEKIKIDHCIVGEPTNPNLIGDMIKVGRRGSLSMEIVINGKSGHVAYPHLAKNPLNKIIKICDSIKKIKFSKKVFNFPQSNLEITSIDTGNKTSNVIPGSCKVSLNIRYNTAYTKSEILSKIRSICKKYSNSYSLKIISSNNPFYTKPEKFTDIVSASIKKITGKTPLLSTTGGTSDARFIKDICPVIEFGGVGKTMHQTNEHIFIKDLYNLKNIYKDLIISYNNFYG